MNKKIVFVIIGVIVVLALNQGQHKTAFTNPADNKYPNGGFEVWNGNVPDQWSVSSPNAQRTMNFVSQNYNDKRTEGLSSLKVTTTLADCTSGCAWYGPTIAVTPGKRYTARISLLQEAGSRGTDTWDAAMRMCLILYQKSDGSQGCYDTVNGYTFPPTGDIGTGFWSNYFSESNAPSTAVSMRLMLQVAAHQNYATFYVDDFRVEEVTTTTTTTSVTTTTIANSVQPPATYLSMVNQKADFRYGQSTLQQFITDSNKWIADPVTAAQCGDNYCVAGDETNCPQDCAYNNKCGDAYCTPEELSMTEYKDNCPIDCWANDTGFSITARPMGITYRTYPEAITALDNMMVAHSSVMSKEVIGNSLQGKPIYMYKIGNPSGGRFMFDGRAHGMEDCGTENGIAFVSWVLTANTVESNDVLTKNYLFFIPGINIDSTRRQNMRRLNPDGTKPVWGVDLNRNGFVGWGSTGTSSLVEPFEYRGYAAGSEPETQAVYNAITTYQPQIYMNVHCGSNMLHYGTYDTLTQDTITKIKAISDQLGTNTIGKTTPGYYPPGPGCNGGYVCKMGSIVPGASVWIHETAGWGQLPPTLQGYLDLWYRRAFPIYLGMAQAVQT